MIKTFKVVLPQSVPLPKLDVAHKLKHEKYDLFEDEIIVTTKDIVEYYEYGLGIPPEWMKSLNPQKLDSTASES